jgi:hypothetical protein
MGQKKLLFEIAYHVTGVEEFGSSFEALMTGKLEIPKEGFRVNVGVQGPVSGPEFTGTAKGVDYMYVRADGRMQLDVKATITTDDGKNISFAADGVGIPQPDGTSKIVENAILFSSHPEYVHLNTIQVWGIGTVTTDMKVLLKFYAAI